MKKVIILLFALVILLPAEQKGFQSIFDGKTLKGWNGDPKFWSVKDGAITGQTTKANPTKGNTFIIWEGGELKDFILEVDFKIIGGNSGIQYRSFKKSGNNDGWRIGGYQADFAAGAGGDRYSGICYGEAFRGILSLRGDKTTLTKEGGKLKKKVEKIGDAAALGKLVKKEDWNTFRIEAKGFELTHYINNKKMTVLVDNDEKTRRADGLLAFQLHAGPPMVVQFKNIRVKHLN
ncbi:MAG TPA: DUF1080 domain-containing protein [Verrucomicrobiales bacterium]|nr:DUF1080 domain-containing protein [Verrucomicrobiales bacterium]|tara:strand:+ start:882 stop:1583 length:702 start_codon:yes stop_codon:yes gene_type:complete